MLQLIRYILLDIVRTRFILFYTLLLLLSSIGMFQLDGDTSKVLLSLMNIVLIVVPLVSVVFTTIHFYNSYEFIELMLAQPVDRRLIFLAEFLATVISLVLAYLIGVGVPMIIYGGAVGGMLLLFTGSMLTVAFVSLAFLSSVLTRDKAKAIGLALLFWLYFALIYDAFIMWFIYHFSEYPLERATLALVSLNPVDLARIMMMLELDISALMGYSGAFFKQFFGSAQGGIFSTLLLILWSLIPIGFATRIFRRKDL
ncbi:MAG: ABC transporter permease subunit [Bacteroidia bacterium]